MSPGREVVHAQHLLHGLPGDTGECLLQGALAPGAALPDERVAAGLAEVHHRGAKPGQEDRLPVMATGCLLAQILFRQNRKNTPPSSKLAVIMGKET